MRQSSWQLSAAALSSFQRCAGQPLLSRALAAASQEGSQRGADSATEHTRGWLVAGAAALGATLLSAPAFAKQQETVQASSPYILYQYEICPWCCKVKAVMDYHNLAYRAVEVNPVWKQQLQFSTYKKVPVLITPDGEQLNESNDIIDYLIQTHVQSGRQKSSWFGKSKSGAAPPPSGLEEEKRWRQWADERLVRLVTANIYSSWGQAAQSMRYITETGNWGQLEKSMAYGLGTVSMYVVGMRMPKKYNIEGDLRQNLYVAVDEFVAAVGTRDFLGGKAPNVADLVVFGIIRAVQNTDTFYDVLENTGIKPWWFRMVETVGESSRVVEVADA